MMTFFKKKKLQKDFDILKNKVELLEKCSPGGYFLVATHTRNIILGLNGITDLNKRDKVKQVLLNLTSEIELMSQSVDHENLFLLPPELVQALFNVLYKGLLLDNFHLHLGIIELLGNLTRKGKFYRLVTGQDKNYFVGGKSLYEAIKDINEEYENNKLDPERRDEDIQNIMAMADFRKSIEDGSLGGWARSWKDS